VFDNQSMINFKNTASFGNVLFPSLAVLSWSKKVSRFQDEKLFGF